MSLERGSQIFERIIVTHLVAGNTTVNWEMSRYFHDPGPYTFQLQVGHTASEASDNWTNIGAPVVDDYQAIDTDQRLFGKTADTHFRVKLTTSVGTYYSNPQNVYGILSRRDWILAREIHRKEKLRHLNYTSTDGFLLKARRYGPACPVCLDKFTDEVTNTQCPYCYGTGFELGYFDPMPANYTDISNNALREHRDARLGTIQQNVISARFLAEVQLYSYDLWVDQGNDARYYIHTVTTKAQLRGVPIVYEAELREAPQSDIAYQIPITAGSLILAGHNQTKPKVEKWSNNDIMQLIKKNQNLKN